MDRQWTLPTQHLADYETCCDAGSPAMHLHFMRLSDSIAPAVRGSLGKDGTHTKFGHQLDQHCREYEYFRQPGIPCMHASAGMPTWIRSFSLFLFTNKQPEGSPAELPGSTNNQTNSISENTRMGPTPSEASYNSVCTAQGATPGIGEPKRPNPNLKRIRSDSPEVTGRKRRCSSGGRPSCLPPPLPPMRIMDGEVPIATYALEAMSVSTRLFSTGVLVERFMVSLWYFDRACVIRTESFDFRSNPAKLALVLYALTECDMLHAGFDPFTYCPISTSSGPQPSESVSEAVMVFDNFRFSIKKLLHTPCGLISRGTMVYDISHDDSGGAGQVLKLSWPLAVTPRETTTVARLVATIPKWEDNLPDIQFSTTLTSRQLKLPRLELLKNLPDTNFKELDRELHVIAMGKCKKLWEVDNVGEFKNVFIDCVECHYHAYTSGKVLHCDLSENNHMFKRRKARAVGVLNDWDMASSVDDNGDVAMSTARHGTGTLPFMARDLLQTPPPPHLYRHDLESFFYILLWACVHYDFSSKTRNPATPGLPFSTWETDLVRYVWTSKSLFIYQKDEKEILRRMPKENYGLYHDWVDPLWRLLNDAERTKPPTEDQTYDYATSDTFMSTIGQKPRNFKLTL